MIRPNLGEWTVVVAGQWNPAIFSAQWISENLFERNPIEAALAIGPFGSGVRFQSPSLILIPQPDRLIIGTRSIADNNLAGMEAAILATLRLLRHTPIQALGINFGFIEDNPLQDLIDIFDIRDNGTLLDNHLPIRRIEIVREIPLEQGVLALKLSFADAHVNFHFNYNYPVNSADAALELLPGKVRDCKNRTANILQNIFELEAEEVNQA